MKITGIRCTAYVGTMEHPDAFWEERLIRPVDIYPQFRAEGPTFLPRSGASAYRLRSAFVHIETDRGIVGTGRRHHRGAGVSHPGRHGPPARRPGSACHRAAVGHPLPVLGSRPQRRGDDGDQQRAGLCTLGFEGAVFRRAGARALRGARARFHPRLRVRTGVLPGLGQGA